MAPKEPGTTRSAGWLLVLAVLAAIAFSSSASAIPVGVASLLARKPVATAKPAVNRMGSKACPRSNHGPRGVAKKPAADKSAGLTSLSRWFL